MPEPAPAGVADPLVPLVADFPGVRFVCFGFGERQYFLSENPGLLEELSALLPSKAALLMTALSAPPPAAFGRQQVATLRVSLAGEAALRRFIWQSIQADAAGRPIRLSNGPYAGSVFYAATGTYDAFFTCNSWTADGLRAAGIPLGGWVVFAGQVMSQARRVEALQRQ